MHHSAPSGDGVAVHRAEQALRDRFEELLRSHVGPVERFRHAVQIARAVSRDDEIVRLHSGADQVHAAQEGFVVGVESGNDGFHVVRAESLFVEHCAEQMTEDLRRHVPLFRQLVQVEAVVHEVFDGLHVRGEATQADVHFGLHAKQFGEVRGDRCQILTQATVGSNGDAVFARHGDHCGAIVVHGVAIFLVLFKWASLQFR